MLHSTTTAKIYMYVALFLKAGSRHLVVSPFGGCFGLVFTALLIMTAVIFTSHTLN